MFRQQWKSNVYNSDNTGVVDATPDTASPDIPLLDAESRIRWAHRRFGSSLVLNSSFGPQSIVCLRLVMDIDPGIPVVMIELPGPEYAMQRLYRDYLKASLGLDLYIVQAQDRTRKKAALCEFLQAHGARASLSGIRWQQTEARAGKGLFEYDADYPGILKIYPIADWSDARTWEFIERLPAELRHPNYARGQRAVGGALLDATEPKLECGLHL